MLHIAVLDPAMGGRFDNDKDLRPAEARVVGRLATLVGGIPETDFGFINYYDI